MGTLSRDNGKVQTLLFSVGGVPDSMRGTVTAAVVAAVVAGCVVLLVIVIVTLAIAIFIYYKRHHGSLKLNM